MRKTMINLQGRYTSLVFVLFAGLLSILISCKKEENGPPLITNVRLTDPAYADSTINMENGVALGQWIVIQGSNFNTLEEVDINGISAEFNSTFVTDNNIVIYVPDNTPNIATYPADEVINEVRVVTQYGEATYALLVLPPPPIIDSISNEFALPGDQITLYGKYFYFVVSVDFPDNISTTDFTAASDGKTCTVKVPEGIGSGNLLATNQSGTSSASYATMFHDTASLFAEFEAPGFDVPGNVSIFKTSDNPIVPSIKDKYMWFFGIRIPPASYFTQTLALETQYVNYQEILTYPEEELIEDDYPAAKLALEFEIFVYDPWTSGFFEIAFLKDASWPEAYRNYFYYTQVSSDQWGKWVTKRIPVTNFVGMDEAGTTYQQTPLSYADIKGTPFNMNYKNPSVEAGGTTQSILSVAMDNFRIVKISN